MNLIPLVQGGCESICVPINILLKIFGSLDKIRNCIKMLDLAITAMTTSTLIGVRGNRSFHNL
jgi:hypothetical protein